MSEDANAEADDFALLVSRHSRFVFQVAYAILRNPEDCDDVVQETFLRLYRARTWRDIRDERAFLARVSWRIAVSRLSKRKQEGPGVELAANTRNPEEMVMEDNRAAAVHRLIDGLPEELRQPLALSTVEELSSREIAGILGIPEGTVRTRMMRAREILRRKITELEGMNHGKR